nr:hypothetical protein [Tanacetum cinerariifolium]
MVTHSKCEENSNSIKSSHWSKRFLILDGAAVCTTVGITSKEEDTSETFSGIKMPKNGSLFMYATSKSCFSSSTSLEMTGDYVSGELFELLEDGASWSIDVEEGELVDSAGSGATTSTIGAMTSGAG